MAANGSATDSIAPGIASAARLARRRKTAPTGAAQRSSAGAFEREAPSDRAQVCAGRGDQGSSTLSQ